MSDPKQAMELLFNTFKSIAEEFNLEINLEPEEDWETPGGILVVAHGRMFVWHEHGQYHVDVGVDVSDPSVGIFGAWEPATLGSNEEPVLKSEKDLDVISFVTQECVKEALSERLADIDYERSFDEMERIVCDQRKVKD